MDSTAWDERYAASTLLWSAGPNRWVVEELAGLPAGRALDLAAGEGRNARWLAQRGWAVTAIDFSGAALDKARRLTEAEPPEVRARLTWRQQDLTEWEPEPVAADLVLIAYLHLAATDRRRVLHASVDALRQGGVLLVIGHDRTNIEHGTGGPQEPDLLYTPDDLNADLADRDDLEIELAQTRNRPVDGADRPALDVVWRARRRGSA